MGLDKKHWVEFKAPQGKKGAKGDTGKEGAKGDTGKEGAKGDVGANGAKGDVGAKGAKGDVGAKGAKGDVGAKGNTGNAGTGLTLKQFVLHRTYKHGDYVFSRSKSDQNHDSMWIAETEFSADKFPYLDNNNKHWVEFKAPQGKEGAKGDTGKEGAKGDTGKEGAKGDVGAKGAKGDVGAKGNTGNAGTGLTLKQFVLHRTYKHGDYV